MILPPPEHLLCGVRHDLDHAAQAFLVEGRLDETALAAPELPLAGQEAMPGEGLVVLVAVLEVVAGILLEEVPDVLGTQEQVDSVGS
jgi:hypothetical protein